MRDKSFETTKPTTLGEEINALGVCLGPRRRCPPPRSWTFWRRPKTSRPTAYGIANVQLHEIKINRAKASTPPEPHLEPREHVAPPRGFMGLSSLCGRGHLRRLHHHQHPYQRIGIPTERAGKSKHDEREGVAGISRAGKAGTDSLGGARSDDAED